MINAIPSSVPTLPRAIMDAQPDAAVVRMATVATIGPTGLGIRVASAKVVTQAGWVQSYRPMLGDVVAVSRQGAKWIVLGSMGSTLGGSTDVVNYNFSQGAVGSAPPGWQLVTTAGSPTLTTQVWSDDDPLDDRYCGRLSVAGAGTVTTQVVSAPITCTTGEVWAVGGHVRTGTDFAATTTCSVQATLAWYGDDTLGSFISQTTTTRAEPVARGMDWRLLRVQGAQGIPCPPTAERLRVNFLVSWTAAAGDAIYFNRVIARRVQ